MGYGDRKKLYEGGAEVLRAEWLESTWKEKFAEFSKRPAKKLPKWFGVRPGKKAGDPETPEGEEEAAEGDHREHQDRRVPRSLDRRPHLALRAPHACAPLRPRALLWHLMASCEHTRHKLAPEEQQVWGASASATRDRPTSQCMGTFQQRRYWARERSAHTMCIRVRPHHFRRSCSAAMFFQPVFLMRCSFLPSFPAVCPLRFLGQTLRMQ